MYQPKIERRFLLKEPVIYSASVRTQITDDGHAMHITLKNGSTFQYMPTEEYPDADHLQSASNRPREEPKKIRLKIPKLAIICRNNIINPDFGI